MRLRIPIVSTRDRKPGFARAPNGGLIVTSGTQQIMHREFIIALAVRLRTKDNA
jgi:hypothetical protein